MLTPKEVSEHAFSKAAFGGYSMAMVDEFLDTVTQDYTALYKENAALKAKMKVLVDKIEEYRSTEEGMRKTLLTAQNMADEMIREAEAKRDQMMAQVEREARSQLEDLRQELEQEEARLAAAKAATADYVARVQSLYREELVHLEEIANEVVSVPAAPAAPVAEPDPVAEAVAEIEASMAQMLRDEEDDMSAEPVQEEVSEEDEDIEEPEEEEPQDEEEDDEDDDLVFARRLNLNDLRFGRDFDMN